MASMIALMGVIGCGSASVTREQSAGETSRPPVDDRGFDPLELSRDREIVPAKYPRSGVIAGKQVIVPAGQVDFATDPTGVGVVGPRLQIDSLNSQVYRVQIFTGRVYGEARQAAKIAEEIFDQPVYVDYQVPNYKVRVGNFVDRDGAESYQQRARTAGYSNAWVVMVNIGIKEVAPLYDAATGYFLPAPVMTSDSTNTPNEQVETDSDIEN